MPLLHMPPYQPPDERQALRPPPRRATADDADGFSPMLLLLAALIFTLCQPLRLLIRRYDAMPKPRYCGFADRQAADVTKTSRPFSRTSRHRRYAAARYVPFFRDAVRLLLLRRCDADTLMLLLRCQLRLFRCADVFAAAFGRHVALRYWRCCAMIFHAASLMMLDSYAAFRRPMLRAAAV